MFWKFDLNTTSHVDKLLDKEHVTLQELMDEDDILQECKAPNQKLLDFLCRQQCMEELVSLITQDPPLDVEEKVRFKLVGELVGHVCAPSVPAFTHTSLLEDGSHAKTAELPGLPAQASCGYLTTSQSPDVNVDKPSEHHRAALSISS
ncbi:serine/threonine-protein phosphatase 6 regulatory subunit 2-like [Piliocolobus tephrosceles]|uniref:serine/threonine-protein phosphatase 6 regulatory subunit 2-like n=1 Tax=Piliocolobus tephrosceles TaxID=591936 RepID=UPI000E6B0F19|nr:serine/threonine-protein phosphatase 6 regulatory subunit 2-like [Piliocolobus tephrosceles]